MAFYWPDASLADEHKRLIRMKGGFVLELGQISVKMRWLSDAGVKEVDSEELERMHKIENETRGRINVWQHNVWKPNCL